jgi:hypothetical protein
LPQRCGIQLDWLVTSGWFEGEGVSTSRMNPLCV